MDFVSAKREVFVATSLNKTGKALVIIFSFKVGKTCARSQRHKEKPSIIKLYEIGKTIYLDARRSE